VLALEVLMTTQAVLPAHPALPARGRAGAGAPMRTAIWRSCSIREKFVR